MTWFAWKGLNGGKAVNLTGLTEKAAAADGFHGYATEAEAEAKPNSVNPLTRVEAEAFIPGTFANNPDKSVAGAAGSAAASVIPQQVTQFFSDLGEKATWLRIAKVVVGSVMIIIGLARITGAGAAVTSAAKGALP
jgi:hypothetical protein